MPTGLNNPYPTISKMTPRIFLSMPYYGAFPNYFQLYLDSVEKNRDILTILIMTDIDTSSYKIPDNVKIVCMTIDDVRERAKQMLKTMFDRSADTKELITTPYKLVDFKVTFPIMFEDHLRIQGATEKDYVGWGDCDLIYGKLTNFLHLNQNYDILGGYHGHFTAIRNLPSHTLFFKEVPNFANLCLDNRRVHITDEIACRSTIVNLKKNGWKMFHTNAHFCDIVPPVFFHLFRSDHKERARNFFDVYNAQKDIKDLWYHPDGSLTVYYEDGTQRDALYCHLQKRAMVLPFSESKDGYWIKENAFAMNAERVL